METTSLFISKCILLNPTAQSNMRKQADTQEVSIFFTATISCFKNSKRKLPIPSETIHIPSDFTFPTPSRNITNNAPITTSTDQWTYQRNSLCFRFKHDTKTWAQTYVLNRGLVRTGTCVMCAFGSSYQNQPTCGGVKPSSSGVSGQ